MALTGSLLALVFLAVSAGRELVSVDRYFKPRGCDEKKTRRSELGDFLVVHFVGSVGRDGKGKTFDSTRDAGRKALEFELVRGKQRAGLFVEGWTDAMLGMCVGEKRVAVIPASLAFGAKGFGAKIPPDSPIHFDIELVGLSDTASGDDSAESAFPDMFTAIDTDGDKQISRDEMRAWFQHMQKSGSGKALPREGVDGLMHLFTKDDKDKDGLVSFQEFSGPKGLPPSGPSASDEVRLPGGVKLTAVGGQGTGELPQPVVKTAPPKGGGDNDDEDEDEDDDGDDADDEGGTSSNPASGSSSNGQKGQKDEL
eukprot:g4513.t1